MLGLVILETPSNMDNSLFKIKETFVNGAVAGESESTNAGNEMKSSF